MGHGQKRLRTTALDEEVWQVTGYWYWYGTAMQGLEEWQTIKHWAMWESS